jgi:hypothetical protein
MVSAGFATYVLFVSPFYLDCFASYAKELGLSVRDARALFYAKELGLSVRDTKALLSEDARLIPVLAAKMDSPKLAAKAIGSLLIYNVEFYPQVLGLMVNALTNANGNARIEAMDSLRQSSSWSRLQVQSNLMQTAKAVINQNLEDSNPDVRLAAARVIASRFSGGSSRVLPILLAMLSDPHTPRPVLPGIIDEVLSLPGAEAAIPMLANLTNVIVTPTNAFSRQLEERIRRDAVAAIRKIERYNDPVPGYIERRFGPPRAPE